MTPPSSLSSTQILYALLFVGVIFCFVWLLLFRKSLSMNVFYALVLSFLSMAAGVFSVSLFAWLESIGNPESGGKISLFGGVFFMPVFFWLGSKLSKRKISTVFDIFSIPMIVAMMCGRTSCLLTGCCEGLPIPGMNGIRWPTRELELVFYIVFLLIVAPKVLKRKTCGEVYPLYMTAYGFFRLIIETFRTTNSNTLIHLSHFWALISLSLGISLYFELRKKR